MWWAGGFLIWHKWIFTVHWKANSSSGLFHGGGWHGWHLHEAKGKITHSFGGVPWSCSPWVFSRPSLQNVSSASPRLDVLISIPLTNHLLLHAAPLHTISKHALHTHASTQHRHMNAWMHKRAYAYTAHRPYWMCQGWDLNSVKCVPGTALPSYCPESNSWLFCNLFSILEWID